MEEGGRLSLTEETVDRPTGTDSLVYIAMTTALCQSPPRWRGQSTATVQMCSLPTARHRMTFES